MLASRNANNISYCSLPVKPYRYPHVCSSWHHTRRCAQYRSPQTSHDRVKWYRLLFSCSIFLFPMQSNFPVIWPAVIARYVVPKFKTRHISGNQSMVMHRVYYWKPERCFTSLHVGGMKTYSVLWNYGFPTDLLRLLSYHDRRWNNTGCLPIFNSLPGSVDIWSNEGWRWLWEWMKDITYSVSHLTPFSLNWIKSRF